MRESISNNLLNSCRRREAINTMEPGSIFCSVSLGAWGYHGAGELVLLGVRRAKGT